jgi:hypothetical protein
MLTVNDGQIDSSPDDVVVIAALPNVVRQPLLGSTRWHRKQHLTIPEFDPMAIL